VNIASTSKVKISCCVRVVVSLVFCSLRIDSTTYPYQQPLQCRGYPIHCKSRNIYISTITRFIRCLILVIFRFCRCLLAFSSFLHCAWMVVRRAHNMESAKHRCGINVRESNRRSQSQLSSYRGGKSSICTSYQRFLRAYCVALVVSVVVMDESQQLTSK
jgi:hypothetical protein